MNRLVLAVVGMIAIIGFMIPIPSFAIHQSEDVVWQLVMISSYSGCSNYHYQMAEKYNEITKEYLKLYQLENSNYDPTCLTESEYDTEFETEGNVDLLILVFDRNKGRADLHSNDIGGFFSHVGEEWTNNHTIVICDCSNFRFSNPSWILTHELSHFILYYLDFDRTIVEDHIHKLDAKFDYCIEVEHSVSCNEVKTRMDTKYLTVSVMTPYEPAIGLKPLSLGTEDDFTLESATEVEMMSQITQWWVNGMIPDEEYQKSLKKIFGYSETFEDSALSEDKLIESHRSSEINNRLTKWWIEGKISDSDYARIMESRISFEDSLNNDPEISSTDSFNVVFTDPPKSKKLEMNEHTFLAENAKSISNDILKLQPYFENDQVVQNENKELPQWFKTRADWWLADKINTEEYIAGIKFVLAS